MNRERNCIYTRDIDMLEKMDEFTNNRLEGYEEHQLNAIEGEKSPVASTDVLELIHGALTDEIDNREMFMTGFDYPYYCLA